MGRGSDACSTVRRATAARPQRVFCPVGVVSLPHGFGHGAEGARLDVAGRQPGVSSNLLTDENRLDVLSGNGVLNGIPVEVAPA